MATPTQRTLLATSFVVAGVAAFLLAYLFIGTGPPAPRAAPPAGRGAPAAMGADDAAVPSASADRGDSTAHPSASHQPWQPAAAQLPPTAVGSLRLASNTMADFTLAWDPAVDDTGIRCYRVLVNGVLADTTSSTQVTLGWLAGKQPILVQVAAVDVDGAYGSWSALYVVPPPDPAPAPTATTASASPSPSSTPSASPTGAPSTPSVPADPATSASTSSGDAVSSSPTPSDFPTAVTTPTATATASGTSSASPTPTPSPTATPSPGL